MKNLIPHIKTIGIILFIPIVFVFNAEFYIYFDLLPHNLYTNKSYINITFFSFFASLSIFAIVLALYTFYVLIFNELKKIN